MKEQEKKKDVFQILFLIIIGLTVFLSIVQAVMIQNWLMASVSVVYVIMGILVLYQEKSNLYRKMNTGHKIGFLLTLVGVLYIDALMMFRCQIPDFAMKLVWAGFGIVMISIFFDRIKAKR